MSDIAAVLLAELHGISIEDYRMERTHDRRMRSALARRYNYRPTRDIEKTLDSGGRIQLVRRHVVMANDYEAIQGVLYTATMEAL